MNKSWEDPAVGHYQSLKQRDPQSRKHAPVQDPLGAAGTPSETLRWVAGSGWHQRQLIVLVVQGERRIQRPVTCW